jgi:hypothetical protein
MMNVRVVDIKERILIMNMKYSVLKEEMKGYDCGWSKTICTGTFIRLLEETDKGSSHAAVSWRRTRKSRRPCFSSRCRGVADARERTGSGTRRRLLLLRASSRKGRKRR